MYRVLQVDDEPLFLSGLRTLIDWEELGIDAPDSALGGEEALGMLLNTPYDILITDIRMPDMSGLDLIREVRKRGGDIKILIISGHDDFGYLKTAFQYGIENYLLKPVDADELTQTLLYTIEKIESEREREGRSRVMDSIALDNVLNSWIDGSMSAEALWERLALMQIRLDRKYYRACVVRAQYPEQWEGAAAQSGRAVQNLFRQFFHGDEDLYITYNLNGDLVLILAGDARTDEDELDARIISSIKSCLGESAVYHAAVGRWADHPMALSHSYRDAVDYLIYGLITPDARLFSGERIEARVKAMEKRLGFDRARLTALLDQCDDTFLSELDALSQSLKSRIDALDDAIIDILAIVFSQAMKRKKGPPGVDFASALGAKTPSEKIDALCGLILEYRQANPPHSELHPMVARVLKCVEENYGQDLSLKTLAAEYNVSQTYLGRIFKKDTDALFTQYLSDFRIDKAKELLLTTTKKSAEIAAMTGFSNPNYFANVFKKRVGVYPTLFRRQHQRTGEHKI